MNDDRTLLPEQSRQAFERAYAAIPAITPTKETAWQIWNAALSAPPAQEPVAYIDPMKFAALRRFTDRGGVLTTITPHRAFPDDVALYASPLQQEVSAAPAQEPVMWQYRWTNPAGDIVPPSMLEWKEVQPWTAIQSLEQRIEELRSLCYQGKHAYEVRALSASPLPQEPQEGKELTDSDQMRAEFMAWAQDRGCDTDGAWSAWQACWNLRGAQEGKAGEWRTIESAPKDGTYILVANEYGTWIAHWYPVAVSGYRFDQPWRSVMLNHYHIPKEDRYAPPTHWQPLPPLPSSKGEQR